MFDYGRNDFGYEDDRYEDRRRMDREEERRQTEDDIRQKEVDDGYDWRTGLGK